ncbi:Alpha/Beta hydrolase protein [Talaromyces proteolyticus]|uniref:Alpha/Beta hydrolase protein n=1 Tax=Talaromyces proteolyticus TaxID=1131652 RepID=A0AAD4Q3C7_9EURO|nr:Alpha/Beta hydrolase protein [Talaromyces proteolyticus]KAH8701646.1 Alpha/Beta hydrolase protein [Talaromyces proteolyticus]
MVPSKTVCTGSAFDITITKEINELVTDTQKKRISVVVRGSTSPTDFSNDLDTALVVPKLSGVDFPSGVMIMAGINIPWSAVHDEIITEVKKLVEIYPDYTQESTGHSLGGALTYMPYISLSQNFPNKSITSNALAAFPIGNQAFANFGSSQHGTLNWGNNALDSVPPFNFAYYGNEYYSYGTPLSTLQCNAGNGMYGVTPEHVSSFDVLEMMAGCDPVSRRFIECSEDKGR